MVVLLLIVGAAIAAELLAPRLVADRVEERVRERTDETAEVSADAGAFPFLPDLLLDGVMDHLTVTLEEVGGQQLTFASVTFGLEGIHLDRDALFEGEVDIERIDTGLVEVEIDQAAVSESLGSPVDLDPAMAELRERTLVLAPEGAPGLDVAVPEELLPCTPQMEDAGDRLRLFCTIDQVPSVLVR